VTVVRESVQNGQLLRVESESRLKTHKITVRNQILLVIFVDLIRLNSGVGGIFKTLD